MVASVLKHESSLKWSRKLRVTCLNLIVSAIWNALSIVWHAMTYGYEVQSSLAVLNTRCDTTQDYVLRGQCHGRCLRGNAVCCSKIYSFRLQAHC